MAIYLKLSFILFFIFVFGFCIHIQIVNNKLNKDLHISNKEYEQLLLNSYDLGCYAYIIKQLQNYKLDKVEINELRIKQNITYFIKLTSPKQTEDEKLVDKSLYELCKYSTMNDIAVQLYNNSMNAYKSNMYSITYKDFNNFNNISIVYKQIPERFMGRWKETSNILEKLQ